MLFFLVVCALFLPLFSFALPSPNSHYPFHRRSLRPRIMTYYPDWAPPKTINYSLFDVVVFAFALPNQNYGLDWDSPQAPAMLENVARAAHAAPSKVMLSIGGWTGSRYFSDAVATPYNREIFANNIHEMYMRYNLDGIDIDWEYPGQSAQQGNSESPSDYSNMLQFFQVLRQTLPPSAMISAAVQDSPFVGPDGHPTKDVSAFSQCVDWITLMNYDTNETRQPPGPNAPLSDTCGNSSQPSQNAVGGYNAWTSAGFPASKIVLGVPAYGYIIQSDARRLSARSPFRAYSEDGSGQVQFQSLIDQGILAQDPDGSFRPPESSGFTRGWDNCSATPFLHSDSAEQVIAYDDVESLAIKAAWVKNMNLGGINMFDVHGDTPRHDLAHALRANLFPIARQPTIPSSDMSSSTPVPISPNTIPPATSTVSSSTPVPLSPNTVPARTSTTSSSTSPIPSSSSASMASSAPLSPTLPGIMLASPRK